MSVTGISRLPRLAAPLSPPIRAAAEQATVLLCISLCLATAAFFSLRLANTHLAHRLGLGLTAPSALHVPHLLPRLVAATTASPVIDEAATAPEVGDGTPAPPAAGALAKPQPVRAGTWIPVLMYHYVRVAPANDRAGQILSVTPDAFAVQMRYLRDNGYHTLTMQQADQALLRHDPLPSKPVVLTFDDGYQDFYTTAVPIMRSLGITATAYLPTGLLERNAYMTWAEVRDLDSQGFEMAAHTINHVDLSRADPARARLEIFGSKEALESHLGHAVVDFCYPSGAFDYRVMALVQEAGFLSATTTQMGGWHTADHMYDMARVRVSGGESMEEWARNLEPFDTPTPVTPGPTGRPSGRPSSSPTGG